MPPLLSGKMSVSYAKRKNSILQMGVSNTRKFIFFLGGHEEMSNFEFFYAGSRAPDVLTIDGIWTSTTCLLFSTKRGLALERPNSFLISSIGISSQNTWGKGLEHPPRHISLYPLKRQVFPNPTFT